MSDALDHIVFSKNVIEFVTVANEYCILVEDNGKDDVKTFILKIQKILPLLYLKTSLLPNIEDESDEVMEKFVTEEQYHHLLNQLTEKLGEHDSYLEVFDDGMAFSEKPVDSSISENLCDIFQDLKDFLMVYRLGNTDVMNYALSICQLNFIEYWGQRLVNCMRAIHMVVYQQFADNEGVANGDAYDKFDADAVLRQYRNLEEE